MNLTRFFRLPADLPPWLRSNITHYYADISWWGLYAGATAAFLSIYAARIGATPTQIGLLTALPAAVTLLLSLPFAGVVQRMGAHRATWVGAFVARFMLLSYVLLPFFLVESAQVTAILVIASLMSIPNTLTGISFNQLFIEALPPDWRGPVVGTRNAFFSMITFVVTLISGQILTHLIFPVGYQVVFFIGFFGAFLTSYQLFRVCPMASVSRPVALLNAPPPGLTRRLPTRVGLLARGKRIIPTVDAQGRRYLRVISLLFLFNMVNNMATPLVPEVLVNTLRLSDATIAVGTAGNSLIIFILSLSMVRLSRSSRAGLVANYRAGTAIGAVLVGFQAVVLALATNEALYFLSVLVGGIGSGILLTAQFNYHLENIPETDRPVWLSWNLLLGNAALLLGALVGPLFAGQFGVPVALLGFGALRFSMGLVLLKAG